METLPFTGRSPPRAPLVESPTPPPTQEFSARFVHPSGPDHFNAQTNHNSSHHSGPHTPFMSGVATPASSSRTDATLLPTHHPIQSLPVISEKEKPSQRFRRALKAINVFFLGKEQASVYWYASLLSVLAALVVTGSSIFGWPPLPIWEYLRHVTR
ncbi:hypothetical protein B0J18DRAFT_46116 [Chaetomium sp. MPI-SDFR-AT-0129]|nr:hypothetical protein B0J18DRAFT_46116 [Chaetomium sp. MPI-SDFR-AT-0129]